MRMAYKLNPIPPYEQPVMKTTDWEGDIVAEISRAVERQAFHKQVKMVVKVNLGLRCDLTSTRGRSHILRF